MNEDNIEEFLIEGYKLSVYVRRGSRHLVLMLHGLGCSKDSFAAIADSGSLADYSLCAIDLLGFGNSEKPDDFSYDLLEQAKLVKGIIDRFDFDELTVVGHSMGGAVGLLLSNMIEVPIKFISVEGNLVSRDCGLVSRKIAEQGIERFSRIGYEEFYRSLERSSRLDMRAWCEWLSFSSPRAFFLSAKSLVYWSDSGVLIDIFNGISKRSYVCGDEDDKSHIKSESAGACFVEMKECGHFMMVDSPEYFCKTISSLINEK